MNTLVSYVVRQSHDGFDCTVYIDGTQVAETPSFSDWDEAWAAGQSIQEAVHAAIKTAISLAPEVGS